MKTGPAAQALKDDLAEKTGRLSKARAEAGEASLRARRELEEEMAESLGQVDEAITRGKRLAVETARVSRSQTTTSKAPARRLVAELFDPAYGWRWDVLRANPAIASIFNRHLGRNFFPMLEDGAGMPIVEAGLAAMRGGGAMATRGLRWKDLVREKGAKWANKKAQAIAEDLGAYFSANPELAKGVAPGLAKAASGVVDDEAATAIKTVLSERISGRMMPKYLVDARRALDEARVSRDRAKAAADDFKASGGFRDQAKRAEAQGAESAEDLAWRSRMRGQETEAGSFMRQLANPRILPFAGAGAVLGGVPGALLGAIASPAIRSLGRSLGYRVGKMLHTRPEAKALLETAPESVRRIVGSVLGDGRREAAVVAVLSVLAAQDPEARRWMEGVVAREPA